MTPSYLETLQQRVAESELGKEWINDPLMILDIWLLTALGYSEEDCQMINLHNIYFNNFSLSWLKLLTKLTAKAVARQGLSVGTLIKRIYCLSNLDRFLVKNGYTQPEELTNTVIQEFLKGSKNENRQVILARTFNIWAEEKWLQVSFNLAKYKPHTPKIEIIPEEVLYQVYEKFDLFPPPLERIFRLQLVLGVRIGEMLRMPRQCLKREGNQWFLLRWVEKHKHWRFCEVHPLVVELVQEQQRFLDAHLGEDVNFDNLFCKASIAYREGVVGRGRFLKEPIYMPKRLRTLALQLWLKAFSEEADLKDKHGNRFYLKSHMFRRTRASIMAYCEVEDEYIAAVLGQGEYERMQTAQGAGAELAYEEAKTTIEAMDKWLPELKKLANGDKA